MEKKIVARLLYNNIGHITWIQKEWRYVCLFWKINNYNNSANPFQYLKSFASELNLADSNEVLFWKTSFRDSKFKELNFPRSVRQHSVFFGTYIIFIRYSMIEYNLLNNIFKEINCHELKKDFLESTINYHMQKCTITIPIFRNIHPWLWLNSCFCILASFFSFIVFVL